MGLIPRLSHRRLNELEAQRAHLQDKGKGAGSDVVEIHPGAAQRYRTIVRDLRAELAERSPQEKFEVIASVRSLVEKIVIYPRNDPQGRDLELVGQLAALLDTHKLSNRTSMRNVVAEDGFEPPTHGL
jgi:site-specific DNA recombinase